MSSINLRNVSFMIILLFLLTMTFIYIVYANSKDFPTYVDLYHVAEDEEE